MKLNFGSYELSYLEIIVLSEKLLLCEYYVKV